MTKLHISPDLALPLDAVTETFAIRAVASLAEAST